MLVVKVWCLSVDSTEKQLRNIHQKIVTAATGIPGLHIKEEKDICVLFPKDMMSYGLGQEIIIEVSNIGVGAIENYIGLMADSFASALKEFFPHSYVQCQVATTPRINSM